MSYLEKLDVLVMLIDVLAEHEKQLDSTIERLEKTIEKINAKEKASKIKNIYFLTIINEIKI